MKRRTLISVVPLAAVAACAPATQPSASPPGDQPTRTARSHEVVVEEQGFVSDGKRLYGRVLRPVVDGVLPTAVFSHALGGSYAQEQSAQQLLASRGVVVYSFDFAGGANSSPPLSEGESTEMSVLTETQNLRDAIATVRALDYVDQDRIYLVGASQGSVVTTLVADEQPEGVRGLVLLCPAFSLFDYVRQVVPNPEDLPERYTLLGFEVGARYFRDAHDIDIYQHMRFPGPVLIAHGTDDPIVPISASERAAATFPNATLMALSGEGHQFSEAAQRSIAEAVLTLIYQ